ncbi:collagen alpha-2(I) chain-like [Prionailurus bengalensis]|uniref:collagen alpha-2(I) chain-like n=1 Tax=Prionailurus bengalensis TaxID=37029 RepID=UPI001CA90148|nr:collagen alpha-2(I) chain-like [Prionailurus bengalensis]XP_043438894.1 collagen alpha-2(I) chain-like [Prionailurus bengalensis]XP_043438895.1 collagen alpha-2(I) chain-like [Prionailurus bengalensis]
MRMRALDTPPPTSPRLSCTAPCSPLFLTPPHFLQREIGLVQRPRFGRALPVRVLRRAKAVRLRSSIFRAFVYASNSEATFSLLSAPPARRHLVFARPTSPCSKLREKEQESAKGRWVGAAWLPVSCALGVSRRNGACGNRTVGAEAARRARVSVSPGSPGPPRLGAWAAAGPGPRSRRGGGGEGDPRPREARHMPEGSLPPRRPACWAGTAAGPAGPAAPLGKGALGPPGGNDALRPPALGPQLSALLVEVGLAVTPWRPGTAAATTLSSGRSWPYSAGSHGTSGTRWWGCWGDAPRAGRPQRGGCGTLY